VPIKPSNYRPNPGQFTAEQIKLWERGAFALRAIARSGVGAVFALELA
jgi:hypothetical protein